MFNHPKKKSVKSRKSPISNSPSSMLPTASPQKVLSLLQQKKTEGAEPFWNAVQNLHKSHGNKFTQNILRKFMGDKMGGKISQEITVPLSSVLSTEKGTPKLSRKKREIMLLPSAVPGGAQIISTIIDTDAIIEAMNQLGASITSNYVFSAPRFWRSQVARRLQQALGRGNFAQDYFNVSYLETRGINANWTGNVRIRRSGPPQPLGETTGSLTAGGGGSATLNTGQSSSTTDSGKLTGSAGGHEGAPGGGVEVGTSSTRGRSSGVANQANSTTSAQTQDRLQRFQVPLVAQIRLEASLDISGSDYINPIKWGFSLREATQPVPPKSTSLEVGHVIYQTSAGFPPSQPNQ